MGRGRADGRQNLGVCQLNRMFPPGPVPVPGLQCKLTDPRSPVSRGQHQDQMIKRQMYGRAGFTLLRHRILLTWHYEPLLPKVRQSRCFLRVPSMPGAVHVHARSAHRCPLIVEEFMCSSLMTGGGCAVGMDDAPPGHAVAEQAHRPAYLPWAGTDPFADVTVGGDGPGWDGAYGFTDTVDDAHVGRQSLGGGG